MASKKIDEPTVKESGNLNLSGVVPIFDPEEFTFRSKLTRDQMKAIKANPYGFIEWHDKDGKVYEGFIHNEGGIEHDPNEGMAEFTLLKVNRKALGLSYQADNSAVEVGDLIIDITTVDEIDKAKEGEPISQVLNSLIPYIKL